MLKPALYSTSTSKAQLVLVQGLIQGRCGPRGHLSNVKITRGRSDDVVSRQIILSNCYHDKF
eukprot:1732668-Amphidinium_carterae.1